MDSNKYFFVLYICEKRGRDRQNIPYQILLKEKHPLTWQLEYNETYKLIESYIVLSWQEISLDEFNTYKRLIG